MTKADLVARAADAVGPRITKKDCGLVVDAFLDAVKDALEREEGIEIRGFGTFKVRHRKARAARNPRTGERVDVAARAVPVFQPSRLLRARVAQGHGSTPADSPPSRVGESHLGVAFSGWERSPPWPKVPSAFPLAE